MLNRVLLVSESFIKENSNLSDNTWGKFILPAIREAQTIHLQQIIGENLYNTLLGKVVEGTVAEQYEELIKDYIQWYLLYEVMSDIIDVLDVKLANLGTVRSRDEYVDNISDEERTRLKQNYAYKADFYCRRMQQYLLNNRQAFPELDECACEGIMANLKTSASTGLWLGGIRGRVLVPRNRFIS